MITVVTFLPLDDLEAWGVNWLRRCLRLYPRMHPGRGWHPSATRTLHRACRRLVIVRYGAHLCDEIQCGYGRSGKFFAHQWLGIRPDLISVAKGIGNGFPMGAVLI